MNRVVMDETLRARLHGGAAKVTLVDADGNCVGHYVPDDLYQALLDTLLPEDDEREAGLEDYRQGKVVTTPELLAGLHESVRRWEGRT